MKGKLDLQHQKPTAEAIQTAVTLFDQHGALWLENVFCSETIDSLRKSFLKRFEKISRSELLERDTAVDNGRCMLTLDIKGKFNSPEVYANDLLMPILNGLLSSHIRIASFGCVTSLPGARDQDIHIDHPPLFEAMPHITNNIPPYAVTVVVPLVDIDEENGTTGIWEGSHKQFGDQGEEDRFNLLGRLKEDPDYSAAAKPLLRKGDVYLMDYRIIHGGLANRSQVARPIMCMVYSLPWFRDGVNFHKQPPVLISSKQLKKVPEQFRGMFT